MSMAIEFEPGPGEEVVADFAANSRCTHWRCLSTASKNAVVSWLKHAYGAVGERFPGLSDIRGVRVFATRVVVEELVLDEDGKKMIDREREEPVIRLSSIAYDPDALPFPELRQGCVQPDSHALMAVADRLEEAEIGLDRIRNSEW